MNKDRYVFPAIFDYADDGITVTFPDLPGAITCGDTDSEALRMAKECLALHLYGMERDNDDIPEPSAAKALRNVANSTNEVIVLIEVWMPPFRDEMANKAVKKTLTIPKWLDDIAAENNVNYSHVLQDALKTHLGVSDRKNIK
ncbi:type II toxin-antitoxin system HicB family antitoxin [Paenibacillus qinlingensis]|uniref:type II toxin-antitoxin system HicB family antitoxin n=1 Tax=Paenibacillus qinlingensis TaxID=1837343 RepID=UPI001563B8C5|nr:type II toxin-antitoxin system HicB family antitoxin [Paenibacillus qinlingensis]NQX61834.1 type II toxin-antitoxin system HicB family antitoxin [Paenibacillus qinlingensis]